MEIGKRTGTILGRRKRKKINLMEEGIKRKGMKGNRNRRRKSRDLRIKMCIPSKFAARKAYLVPQIK